MEGQLAIFFYLTKINHALIMLLLIIPLNYILNTDKQYKHYTQHISLFSLFYNYLVIIFITCIFIIFYSISSENSELHHTCLSHTRPTLDHILYRQPNTSLLHHHPNLTCSIGLHLTQKQHAFNTHVAHIPDFQHTLAKHTQPNTTKPHIPHTVSLKLHTQ